MNRDKTDCGGGKDKITGGAANKPPDISAEKWISRGRRFAEGMGTKSAWTDEEALDLLNTNAIMSPECEVWKDWCNLRVASDNRICPVLCGGGLYEKAPCSWRRGHKGPNCELAQFTFMEFLRGKSTNHLTVIFTADIKCLQRNTRNYLLFTRR